MTHDLVVVGGGFWGTAIARVAGVGGASVCLLDDGAVGGASRAASGYYARSWYKGPWAERVRAAEELSERKGMTLSFTGADVTASGKREARFRSDWAVFNPEDVLALHQERTRGAAERVEQGRVHLRDGRVLEGRLVVVAAGAMTDRLLAASGLPALGVTALGGRGLILDAYPGALPRTLLVPVTPYHSYAARPWGRAQVRVGETLEVRPAAAPEYVDKLRKAVFPHVLHRSGTGCIEVADSWGLRPVLPEPTVREVAPGVLAATGGGRVGGMLAWWAAAEVARRLR